MKNSVLSRSTSETGPCIDINPYDYSRQGFESVIEELRKHYSFRPYKIAFGLESYTTIFLIRDEEVEVDMDNWYFTISFQTEELGDACYIRLKT